MAYRLMMMIDDVETEKEMEEWGDVWLGEAKPAEVLPKSLHCWQVKMILMNKQLRFASSVTRCRAWGAVGGAGWWSVNEADTPSFCIELIHLIKGACVSPASRSADLYLKYALTKNTPFRYAVNELKPCRAQTVLIMVRWTQWWWLTEDEPSSHIC